MQRIIEGVSLFVLIAVVILRPLVAESYDSAGSPLTAALQTVSDPSPLRTLIFDLFILLAACGWLVARAVGPPRLYRRTGLGWGAGLVAVAAVVSCCAAGNKRLAINASVDWLCYPLMAITLVQLMHRPWHRRLLLSALLASALVGAGHCLEQRFVGFDETWTHYESIKEEFWARQGVDLDSAKVESFERRIQSREATGFMPHSNVTGSYLVLCGMAAVGLSITRWKGRKTPKNRLSDIATSLGAFVILAGVVLTNSLGALIAGLAGIALWAVVVLLGRWIDAHRAKTVVIGWVCAVVGALAGIGYGLYRDALPGWSLTFRWQWWKASWGLIADHWLTGVGRENFGRHYLRYKLIESPEEVANPHNLFVQAASDWGVLGLVGIVTMLVGASLAVARRPSTAPLLEKSGVYAAERPTMLLLTVGLVLVVTLGRLPLLGTDDPNFLYYATVTTGLCWLIGFFLFGIGWNRAVSSVGSSARLVGMGAAIGLFAFVLHDMINFAAFIPGTATTLFAMFAFCIAERSGNAPITKVHAVPHWRLPLAALSAGIVIFAYAAIMPVGRAVGHLRLARQTGRLLAPTPIIAQPAHHHFRRAIEADPLDPTPCLEHARWLMAASSLPELRDHALRLAEAAIDQSIRRDPFSVRLRRTQMQFYRTKAAATGSTDDRLAAIDAARKVVELYPRGPAGFAALADCQLEAGETADSDGLLQKALENYRHALELDDSRLWWEELRRFTKRERQAIESKIERVRMLLEQRSP